MDAKITGKIINAKRKELGMTQIQLAERLNISNRAVSKWENGDGYPDITMLESLSSVLGITIDELLTGRTPDVRIVEVEKEPASNETKRARAKFLISEIIAFCLLAGGSIIGIACEFAFIRLRPFYAFIEIYLLVGSIVMILVATILFFTGYVKYKFEAVWVLPSVLLQLYIFVVTSFTTPAFILFRLLRWSHLGSLGAWGAVALFIIFVIVFTLFMRNKYKEARNEKNC